jgi:two-component system LytT family response regulator
VSRLRAVVVDDEPLARGILKSLLEQDVGVEVVGEAADGESALALIRKERPDVAFLDIEMPERGGIEVAAALAPEELPAVIFVTAYSEHATRAFDLAALDYVVKPFSDERLFAALGRAKERLKRQRLSHLAERIAHLAGELEADDKPAPAAAEPFPGPAPAPLTRIAVTRQGRSLVIPVERILWIASEDYYARLHTEAGSFLVRSSLAWLEERLDRQQFQRVHRQAIVNLSHVTEVEHLLRGALRLVLKDGTRCPVSRSRRAQVAERLLPRLGE